VQSTGDRLLFFNLKLFYVSIKIIYPVNFKYVCIFISIKMTNMCPYIFLCLLVINICPVFLCINEKYMYGFQIVVGEALLQLPSHSLGVSWICCGHWFRLRHREFLDLVFVIYFFVYVYCVVFVLLRGDEDGFGFILALWFSLKILNMVLWIEDLGF